MNWSAVMLLPALILCGIFEFPKNTGILVKAEDNIKMQESYDMLE